MKKGIVSLAAIAALFIYGCASGQNGSQQGSKSQAKPNSGNVGENNTHFHFSKAVEDMILRPGDIHVNPQPVIKPDIEFFELGSINFGKNLKLSWGFGYSTKPLGMGTNQDIPVIPKKERVSLLDEANQRIEKNAHDYAAYLGRAGIYYNSGMLSNFTKAVNDCTTVIEGIAAPSSMETLNELAAAYSLRCQLYCQLGQTDNALDDCESLNNLYVQYNAPMSATLTVYYVEARIYLQNKQNDKAIAMLDKILTVNPNFADAKKFRDQLAASKS